MQTTTTFQQWNAGQISGFGSFHTTLLEAYKLADGTNREKLELAFPEWFTCFELRAAVAQAIEASPHKWDKFSYAYACNAMQSHMIWDSYKLAEIKAKFYKLIDTKFSAIHGFTTFKHIQL